MADYSNIPLLSALKDKMRWLNTNQRVISENIAHANTPGYRAKQLDKADFSSFVEDISNDSGSLNASFKVPAYKGAPLPGGGSVHSTSSTVFTVSEQEGNEESPNGNSVVLEEEMIKLADNQMQYGVASRLYKKNISLIKMALGKGAGK